ncbi:MAG TPA: methyltransferase [Methylomirabilota bacterium]|nr:methyltransferase [Methylomirabilota bacterium]
MTTGPVDRAETIERLAAAVYPSFAMLAGMELDVFTTLKDGPLTGRQVAATLGVDPTRLTALLYGLVAAGLLTVDGEGFTNTPEASQFLVRGRPAYIGMRHHAFRRRWQTVLRSADSIRSGVSEAPRVYAEMSVEQRDEYYLGLHTEALAAGRVLAARPEFARYRRIVDVGGGSGGVAIALAQAWPKVSVTIVDLPATAAVAQRNVDEAGLADRIMVLGADILHDALGESYDAAVLRGVLVVLSSNDARRLLSRVNHALAPGGAIYILGWILDDSRVTPPELATYNLQFATTFDHGGVYTEGEILRWLKEANFHDGTRVRSAAVYGSDLIKAQRG